jgi:hypothetical protein
VLDEADAVPGVRLVIYAAELLVQRQRLLARDERLLVLPQLCMQPPNIVQRARLAGSVPGGAVRLQPYPSASP